MNRTRVLVADPLAIFRAGVCNLLARESDFEVIEAVDLEGVERALARRVDVALIDLDLPPDGGIAAARLVRGSGDARAILWAIEPTQATVLAAISAGAHGFLHKEISPGGLVRSLRGIVRGEAPLARDLATLMIGALHRMEEATQALERTASLTPREREVLGFVARGARNREIASELTLSEFTVKRHVQNILQKLEVPTRRAAAAFWRSAYREGAA
jgi:two-component system nitrate/nitrite response regulator NarL